MGEADDAGHGRNHKAGEDVVQVSPICADLDLLKDAEKAEQSGIIAIIGALWQGMKGGSCFCSALLHLSNDPAHDLRSTKRCQDCQ